MRGETERERAENAKNEEEREGVGGRWTTKIENARDEEGLVSEESRRARRSEERTQGSARLPSERVITIPLKSWPTRSSVGALMRLTASTANYKSLETMGAVRALTSGSVRAYIYICNTRARGWMIYSRLLSRLSSALTDALASALFDAVLPAVNRTSVPSPRFADAPSVGRSSRPLAVLPLFPRIFYARNPLFPLLPPDVRAQWAGLW